MEQLVEQFLPVIIAIGTLLILLIICVWLVFNHGIDKIIHPQEWKSSGSSGEQILYNTLVHKLKIPQNQVLRNVYIPTRNNQTTEIDVLVISKKGIFVFECKNYAGNIYGDAQCKRWVQYIGCKKSYFYNPLWQNRNHVKFLRLYLLKYDINMPIIPLLSTTSRGKWKIKNLQKNDFVLGINSHYKDIYNSSPDSHLSNNDLEKIASLLRPLSRPNIAIRKKHINTVTLQAGVRKTK